jgi:hypothetical protein
MSVSDWFAVVPKMAASVFEFLKPRSQQGPVVQHFIGGAGGGAAAPGGIALGGGGGGAGPNARGGRSALAFLGKVTLPDGQVIDFAEVGRGGDVPSQGDKR